MKEITTPVQQHDISLGMLMTVHNFMTNMLPKGNFYIPTTKVGLESSYSATCLCLNRNALFETFMDKYPIYREAKAENMKRYIDFERKNFRKASNWELLKYGFYYTSDAVERPSGYNAVEPELCAQYIESLSPTEEVDLTAYHDLKSLREHFGLSKAKFCRHLGVAYKTYEKWESGDRTPPPYQFSWIVSYLAQNPPT